MRETQARIAIAERTRDTLHYKSERALPFSSFLDKLQKMFNIFDEENKSITDGSKVWLLLKEVEHPQLQDAIGALRVWSAINGMTFTECANHLAAWVSELPDQQSAQKISSTNTERPKYKGPNYNQKKGNEHKGGNHGHKRKGIYMLDGSVWTSHYDEWNKMSDKDKQTVIDARSKNRSKGGRDHKPRQASDISTDNIASLKSKLDDLQRSLAAVKSSTQESGNDTPDNNAGDSFRRRNEPSRLHLHTDR